jgi:hypothetical protein
MMEHSKSTLNTELQTQCPSYLVEEYEGEKALEKKQIIHEGREASVF